MQRQSYCQFHSESLSKKMKVSPAKGHLALKSLFFVYYGGIGQFFAFLNIYYSSIGLSGVEIGVIGTLVSLIGIFSTTLWGMLSDKFGKPRWLFSIAFLGTALGVLALSNVQTFSWIIVVACLLNLFNMTLMPLLDSTALGMLGAESDRYGSYRVWGSLGFIAASTGVGFLYERIGLHSMFPIFIALMVIAMFISLVLPDLPVRLSGSPWGGLRQMVRKPRWVILASSAFFIWLAATAMLSFLGIMIKNMGGGDGLIGLSGTIAALVELPGMALGALMLSRIGASRMILLACAGYTLRMFLYAIMPSPTWTLGISMLNSITYVPFWLGAVAYAGELAPAELKATSQGLLFSIMNLASMAGGLGSGWLFDSAGASGLFGVMAGCCLAALIIFAAGQAFLNKAEAALAQAPVEPAPAAVIDLRES